MNRSKPFLLTASLFCASCLMGCSILNSPGVTPKTEDLRAVHATYRQEFVEAKLPDPTAEKANGLQAADFSQTFAAIGDYRRGYPDAAIPLAHLTVLEGMIYLQTTQFGLATLVKEDVRGAGGQLSGGGSQPRDALFAATYSDLLSGWTAVEQSNAMFSSGVAVKDIDFEGDINALKKSAINITTTLCKIRAGGQLPAVAGGQGASYVAASAATFLVQADHLLGSHCKSKNKDILQQWQPRCDAEYNNGSYLRAARDLHRTFMPADQQRYIQLQEGTENPQWQANQSAGFAGQQYTDHYLRIAERLKGRYENSNQPMPPYRDTCTATAVTQ